ncbi:H-NS family nucleoid-associated regulatory protein [Stenotrophomonas pavanii]|uniref:H-NS histone family protein n=1 Tax=Stenotrophomonas pavanii TaxID=487698 RepID=UPI003CCE6480
MHAGDERPAGRAGGDGGRKHGRPTKSAGSKVAPKYRNPANPSETWSGRGRQPKWLAALVQKGKEPSEFLIN